MPHNSKYSINIPTPLIIECLWNPFWLHASEPSPSGLPGVEAGATTSFFPCQAQCLPAVPLDPSLIPTAGPCLRAPLGPPFPTLHPVALLGPAGQAATLLRSFVLQHLCTHFLSGTRPPTAYLPRVPSKRHERVKHVLAAWSNPELSLVLSSLREASLTRKTGK